MLEPFVVNRVVVPANGQPQKLLISGDEEHTLIGTITIEPDTPGELLIAWVERLWPAVEKSAREVIWGLAPHLAKRARHHRKGRYMIAVMPTERELTNESGLGRSSVFKAMDLLRAQGWIATSEVASLVRLYFDPCRRRDDDIDVDVQGELFDELSATADKSELQPPNQSAVADNFARATADYLSQSAVADKSHPQKSAAADCKTLPLRSAGAHLDIEYQGIKSIIDIDETALALSSISMIDEKAEDLERRKAWTKFLASIMDFWGVGGTKNDNQRRGDETSTLRMFEEQIWSEDVPIVERRWRLDHVLKLIAKANKHLAMSKTSSKPFSPMAWVTECLRNNLQDRADRRAKPEKSVGSDPVILVRGVLRYAKLAGLDPRSESVVRHVGSTCGWDRAAWLAHLDEFEAAHRYQPSQERSYANTGDSR